MTMDNTLDKLFDLFIRLKFYFVSKPYICYDITIGETEDYVVFWLASESDKEYVGRMFIVGGLNDVIIGGLLNSSYAGKDALKYGAFYEQLEDWRRYELEH